MVNRLVLLIATVWTLASALAGDLASGRTAAVFTVTSTVDAVDVLPGDGLCATRAGACSLRAALNEVSARTSDGTPVSIVVPAGTYPLRINPPPARLRDEEGGDLDLYAHAIPPPSVTITGAGAGRTVVEQLRADRVLELADPEAVTIANLTIRAGRGVQRGGGVLNAADGGLTLRGVEVSANGADEGGGIFSGRPLVIDQSRVSDNSARRAGGGVALSTRGGTITRSTISGNTAAETGGGIWAQNVDSLELVQSLVADNTQTTAGARGIPPYGGGIMIATNPALGSPSSVQISGSTFRGNAAVGGGGLGWQSPGTLAIEASVFAENTAELGGAIGTLSHGGADATTTLSLTNSTLDGNAAERGGAIDRGYGATILRADTIAGNAASAGSGIHFTGARVSYALVTGTIIANEPATQNCAVNGAPFEASEGLTPPGTNIESGTSCHLRVPDRSGTAPRLDRLADNGGPTRTRAPLPSSPAVDRYTAGDCPGVDQRGSARPAGAACDIGAFETGAPISPASAPLPPRRDVLGGNLILLPAGGAGLPTGDFRPCSRGPSGAGQSSRPVAAGFFEPRDAQLATHGSLVFQRGRARAVRLGNLLVLAAGASGRVLALVAPGRGAVPLFDLRGVGYGRSGMHGRLVLTAKAARLLNGQLGLTSFRAGMACGRLVATVRVAGDPGPTPIVEPPPPPPLPPPPPPKTFTLRLVVKPADQGTVEIEPPGVSCTDTCSAAIAEGTSVRLTAIPADGKVFDNWLGDCRTDAPVCRFAMDADKSVTARFEDKK
jgi:CSLREA domain-containing protein